MSERSALVVIDMIRDFAEEGGALFVPEAARVIPAIAGRIARARAAGEPVVYVCDRHDRGDAELSDWPEHALAGTPGAEVVAPLAPREGDPVVHKHTFSGFYGTDLEAILRDLGVGRLVLTGTVTNICVLFTAADAYFRGFRLTVPRDCVAALSEEDGRFALKLLADVFRAEVV